MSGTLSIAEAAAVLREAAASAVPCAPLRDRVADAGMDAAYAVQRINIDAASAAGRRRVGYKIGLTSPAVQAQLGVDQPDCGVLFADMAVLDGIEVPAGAVLQPRVEAEVALVLGRDLDAGHLPYTVADIIRAVDFALPAIEIVGSRIAGWNIGIFDTIADNASSGLFVLGAEPRPIAGLDLRMCGMRMDHGGEPVSTGVGAACLGHPLNAAVWLAQRMAANGQPLAAGDVILTGALGPMVPVTAGGVYEARISGLGSVRAVFAPEEAR